MPPPIDAIALTQQVWTELESWAKQVHLPKFKIVSFKHFFEEAPQNDFSLEARRQILGQSRLLFEHFYVHAPFKRQLGLLDPLAELDRIGDLIATEGEALPDGQFHHLVRNVFVQQEDAHTYYGLPAPYAETLAFLPFQIKRYFDGDGRARFVVSKVMPGFDCPPFGIGAEIVGWSGESFLCALQQSGASEVGGNKESFVANALTRMTIRPLRFADRPPSAEELIEFIAPGQEEVRSILIPWGAGVGFDTNALFPAASKSHAEEQATFGYANLLLMNPKKCLYERSETENAALHSLLPEIFDFQYPGGSVDEGPLPAEHLISPDDPAARLGYIRIKSFQLREASGPVESILAGEFARILSIMTERAPDGMILDIRGNMGGSIRAAEAMLQMISAEPITPARFHWRFTPAIHKILKDLRALRERFVELSDEEREMLTSLASDYGDWLDDFDILSEAAPDKLTNGKPVTDRGAANEVGQIYQGGVVLIVDAFTYSAADIFAGGFQDHGIGPVLGITSTTGGGGAAKWNYPEFTPTLGKAAGIALDPLPGGVTMSMAVLRSSRVLRFDGQFIENVGVVADAVHRPTREDVLSQNQDLMRKACTLLLENRRQARLRLLDTFRNATEIGFRVSGTGFATLTYVLGDLSVVPKPSPDGLWRIPVPDGSGDSALSLSVFGLDADGKIAVNMRAIFPIFTTGMSQ